MGPILTRITAAVAGGLAGLVTGMLVKLGLTITPELAEAINQWTGATVNFLMTVATLVFYGVAHPLIDRFFGKEKPEPLGTPVE